MTKQASHSSPAVRLNGIVKRYGAQAVVAGLSLECDRGTFMTLLGPSGSGKTTTLMMVAGFIAPTSGEIWIDDRNVTELPVNRRDVGLVFQHYALFPHLTVFRNIAFPLEMRHVAKSEIAGRVGKILELVRLTDLAGRYPRQLSGGQQQRVALARVLVFQPSVLLMDEPLSALDRQLRSQMQLELKRLQRELGLTIIHVTHDQEEALAMSDRIVVLRDGKVEQNGTPAEIYYHPTNSFVADFVGQTNFLLGQVKSVGPQQCILLTRGGLEVCVDLQSPLNGFANMSSDRLIGMSIRPERVRLSTSCDCGNVWRARIENQMFLGSAVRYILRLESGEEITALESNPADVAMPVTGETVNISVRAGDIRLLPSG